MMPDDGTAIIEQPQRRRWKRWAAVTLVLLLGVAAWLTTGETATVRRAREVQLGQSLAEVEAIMGPSLTSVGYSTGDFLISYGTRFESEILRFRRGFHSLLRRHRLRSQYVHMPNPVEIRFRNNRVDAIRRGTEFVNRYGVVFQELRRDMF